MHSHLSIRHLISSLERLRPAEARPRAIPDELLGFIQDVCQLFDPFGGIARAGYECLFAEDRWEISVFLGETEAVGGPLDGKTTPVNFQMDLDALRATFDDVQRFSWTAFPNGYLQQNQERRESFLTIQGTVATQPVTLQVHSLAPDSLGPAMLEYHDGRLELT